MAIIPDPGVAGYLWQWFQKLDLAKLSDGSNVPQINNPHIAPQTVPLPPLAEQEAIVETIEDQPSTIEHLETDIEAKLQSAQALRQATLRRAFTGKLVPQDPNDEPASELLKRIAAEREARARKAAATKRSDRKTGRSTRRRRLRKME